MFTARSDRESESVSMERERVNCGRQWSIEAQGQSSGGQLEMGVNSESLTSSCQAQNVSCGYVSPL